MKKAFHSLLNNINMGHNGGNPKAALWICGLENNPGKYFEDYNRHLVSGQPDPLLETTNGMRHMSYAAQDKDNWKSSFNCAIYDILARLDKIQYNQDDTVSNMYATADGKPGSHFFCTNLFPLGFPKTDKKIYADHIAEITGLSPTDYMKKCVEERHNNQAFEHMTKNARVIICTGWEQAQYFIDMFAYGIKNDVSCGKRCRIITQNAGYPTLVICSHPAYFPDWRKKDFMQSASDTKIPNGEPEELPHAARIARIVHDTLK